MKRDLHKLANERYDLIVVGGGINGVSIARDAALRGFRVALVERGDFGCATSFNSLKIVHGGLRYLQHLNFARMRESIRERTILMRIAPHLVHPLPFLMPTYGHGMQSKEIMRLALAMNDLVGFDRNRLADPDKRLPPGRVISKAECLERIPYLSDERLTGGAIWYDCQLRNSERFIISTLQSAVRAGADAANYVEMKDLLREKDRVTGVQVVDAFSGDKFDILGRIVVNAAGPWIQKTFKLLGPLRQKRIYLSKAMNLVCKRPIVTSHAVGITSPEAFVDQHAVMNKGNRLFFLVPWRGMTLIGTTHTAYRGGPDDFSVPESEIQSFMNEVDTACPRANLRREDIIFVYGGLLPIYPPKAGENNVSLQKRYRIYDHETEDRLEGLVSVVGVKFTEARNVAKNVVDLIVRKLERQGPASYSETLPIYGGEMKRYTAYLSEEIAKRPEDLSPDVLRALIENHGAAYREVLKLSDEDRTATACVSDLPPVIKAQIVYAVREEMALKLSDAVMRRTEFGLFGNADKHGLMTCAKIMAKELGWDRERIEREVEDSGKKLRSYQAG